MYVCLQVLRCADFYSGCGGMSFMDQQTDSVHITTAYAVDFCESMTLSFKSNYPGTHVSLNSCTYTTLSLMHKSQDCVASSCRGVTGW